MTQADAVARRGTGSSCSKPPESREDIQTPVSQANLNTLLKADQMGGCGIVGIQLQFPN